MIDKIVWFLTGIDHFLDRVFERFQRECLHDSRYVMADILEGEGIRQGKGVEIKWCLRCGAYYKSWDPASGNCSEWQTPHATWTKDGYRSGSRR